MSELSTIIRPSGPSDPVPTPLHIHSPKPISSCAVGFLSLYSLDEESCPKLDELGLRSPDIQTPEIGQATTLAALVQASTPDESSTYKITLPFIGFLQNQVYLIMKEYIQLPPLLTSNLSEPTPGEKEISSHSYCTPPNKRDYTLPSLWSIPKALTSKLGLFDRANDRDTSLPTPIGFEMREKLQVQHQLGVSANRLAEYERDRVLKQDVNILYQRWDREFGEMI
ncbi:hypothetical protein AA313_de0200022 [Arthrobotrys entomopaga]|nr:hypothetical protein AA313_de0200022 [Arthrobotrys entomopaga]